MSHARTNSVIVFNRPGLAGLLAFILVSWGLGQPGITTDEPLDVAPGRHYWDQLGKHGLGFLNQASVQATFGGNPDHPPLARWLLGAASHGFQTLQVLFTSHADPTGLYIHSARIAPALAFGFTVALIARFVGSRAGPTAGWSSAMCYMFLPHIYAHAHLAAIETILNLTWFAAVVGWLRWIEKPGLKRSIFAGILTALAMLTKIHGWLIIPWALVVILIYSRSLEQLAKGLLGISFAPVCWLLGWPWMWYETVGRFSVYFGGTVKRQHLMVLYFGKVYQDNELPWHSSWVQFMAAITPFAMILFGAGLISLIRRNDGILGRPIAVLIFQMMILFSLPITRYDMDRLFLVVWPLVAVVAGLGAAGIFASLPKTGLKRRLWTIFFALGLGNSVLACFQFSPMSYVSPMVGGLKFFEGQGMDLNYWGDAIDRKLLSRLLEVRSKGDAVAVVPTLHQNQAIFFTPLELMKQGDLFRDQSAWREARYLVVYRRQSYWPAEFEAWIESHEPISLRSRNGIWLGGIWPGPKFWEPKRE